MFDTLKTFLREPLLHFLALGFCFFAAYGALNNSVENDPENRITVDRKTLLTYLQFRAKAFDTERFEQVLDSMPDQDRQRLIDDYVREETLYRQAKALQLDTNDNVARQRLIQQMRYLTQSVVSADTSITDDALQAYYQENKGRYLEPATITFTHVFFSTARRSPESAEALASQQLTELNDQQIPFHQALGFGERFLYHRNYVRKEADLIGSHFGDAMASEVFNLPVSDSQWQGPYQSPYGYHLVLATQQTPAITPELVDIKNRVAQDLLQQRQQQQLELAIEQMVDDYEVNITAEFPSTPSVEGA